MSVLFSAPRRKLGLGSALIKSGPQPDGSERDSSEKISGELVEAGRHPPEMFQFVEESLDEVTLSVDVPINAALHLSVTLGRNVCADISRLSEFDEGFGVVTTISDEVAGFT